MTTRFPHILLVTFCLLTLATSASAECAWVLWLYQLGTNADLYSVESAYTARSECEKEAVGFVPALKSRGYSIVTSSREVIAEKGSNKVRYLDLLLTPSPQADPDLHVL